MKKPNMKFLALLLPLLCSTSAHAKEVLHTFLRPVTGFINHVDPSELRFFDESGLSDVLKIPSQPGETFRITQSTKYTVLDKTKKNSEGKDQDYCALKSQSPMNMGANSGMILAYPYLVGVDRVCIIDESRRQIRLLATLTASPNDYYVAFAGFEGGHYHFLINGRDMSQPTGYLKKFSINVKTDRITRPTTLPLSIPGYSGPMIYSQGEVYITTWIGIVKGPNDEEQDMGQNIVKLNKTMSALIPTQMWGFKGQSQFLLFNELEAFFFNGLDTNIGSYSVTRLTNIKPFGEFIPTCTPVQSYGERQWISYCAEGKTLELRSTEELMVR